MTTLSTPRGGIDYLAQEISAALDDLERIEREGERPARHAFVLGWLLGTIEDLEVRRKLNERLEAEAPPRSTALGARAGRGFRLDVYRIQMAPALQAQDHREFRS